MRRGSALSVCLIAMMLLCTAPLFADRATEDLQSKIIERFDAPDGSTDAGKYDTQQNHRWIVRGSKFITNGFPKFGLVKAYPVALYPVVPDGADLKAFGIQAAFDRQGYNYLEIIPVADKDGADGKPVEQGIPIPGRVKKLDLWVWGSAYDYYLEVHLKDFRGEVHKLELGSINFKGWKNLTVNIPASIPQEIAYVPNKKSLELQKIVLWTQPNEKVDGFYVYLDQIKVLTDMFETPFDGSTLSDQPTVDKLWSGAVGGNKSSSSSTTSTTK